MHFNNNTLDSSGNNNNGTDNNQVQNPSFESGTGVDADDWTEGTNADRVSDQAYSGTYSMNANFRVTCNH